MRWTVLGASGRLTKKVAAHLPGVVQVVRVRAGATDPETVAETVRLSDAVLLGQRMRRQEDVSFLCLVLHHLRDFQGHVVSLGSTTEYLPIPTKGKYGSIKRDAFARVSGQRGRTYSVVHVICPSDVVVDAARVASMISESVALPGDRYLSAARSLAISPPNTDREYREALRSFARSWYAGTVWACATIVAAGVATAVLMRGKWRVATAVLLLSLLVGVVAYSKSGFRYPGVVCRDSLWAPNREMDDSVQEQFESDGIVVVPGSLDPGVLEAREAGSDLDSLMHSPSILQAVQHATKARFQPSTLQGRSPWTLNFTAPEKEGKWHFDQRFCPSNLRVILNLHRCTGTDYFLEFVTPSGETRRIQPDVGDIVIIGTRTLHKPGAMTVGCRRIAFLDFVMPECTVNLTRLTVDKVAHVLKKLGWRV
jgi:hypothetical protein